MNPFVVLIVLDGWGHTNIRTGNVLALARTPNFSRLNQEFSPIFLKASGEAVGLPPGQMGNSEVGHLNLGAGRIVYQELPRISKAIRDKSFFENPAFLTALKNVKKNNSTLHLLGLLSDGGVHSHVEHLYALLDLAASQKITNVCLHAFLDGRDTLPQSALKYIKETEEKMRTIKTGRIATVIGRYYAMDRDQRWERTRQAYAAMAEGEGLRVSNAEEAVFSAYQSRINDEFLLPSLIPHMPDNSLSLIRDNDEMIFFNFRADRIRQIIHAFIEKDFAGFPRKKKLNVGITCLTEYDKKFNLPVAFPPQNIRNGLGEVLSNQGRKQLRMAETEKYAHVTFFFNGGREDIFPGEERILIPSPKVATYDLQPEMSAEELTSAAIKKIEEKKYSFILINYANPDMVGHTGVFPAATRAVETIDTCIGNIVAAIGKAGGTTLITADHGNIEEMIDPENGKPLTAHTTNPVPFYCLLPEGQKPQQLRTDGSLADVAPTVLELLEIPAPPEMTGKSLIIA